MAQYDHRTKPTSEWTYYVVDNLPTMSNIYRYDTPEEAIAKFQELPQDMYSAIGSSINASNEIDHIHRRSEGQPVLVTDCDNMSNPIWRDSPEIQDAIDLMIAELNVQHQYTSKIFGPYNPTTCVELERYAGNDLDSYFQDKLLLPDKPGNYLTAIKEVFLRGQGWMGIEPFLKKLQDRPPYRYGVPSPDFFVDRLNIQYLTEAGYSGQADLSTKDFRLLQEKTERELSPEKLAGDLDTFLSELDPHEYRDQVNDRSESVSAIQSDIASGNLAAYRRELSTILSEGKGLPEDLRIAQNLQARLTALTPSELRSSRLSLADQVRMAEKAAEKAGRHLETVPNREEGR